MMTPIEFRNALSALAKRITTPNPHVSIFFHDTGKQPIRGSIYTNWPYGDPSVSVDGDDWETLIKDLGSAWDAHYATHQKQRTRDIALEIIRITSEKGECTDAALRGFKFSAKEIEELGAAAISEANRMAANGPFSIVSAGKSNGAPAAELAAE